MSNIFTQKERKFSATSVVGQGISKLNKLNKTEIKLDNNDYIVTASDLETVYQIADKEGHWFKGPVEEILQEETLNGLTVR